MSKLNLGHLTNVSSGKQTCTQFPVVNIMNDCEPRANLMILATGQSGRDLIQSLTI